MSWASRFGGWHFYFLLDFAEEFCQSDERDTELPCTIGLSVAMSIKTILYGSIAGAACIGSYLGGLSHGYFWASDEYEQIHSQMSNHMVDMVESEVSDRLAKGEGVSPQPSRAMRAGE